MTVDATQPTGKTAAEIEAYIRENRTELNTLGGLIGAIGGSAWFDFIDTFAGGTLVNGVSVQNVMFNVVALGAAGAVDLTDITVETDGQIKLFHFLDGNITVKHDNSYIKLAGAQDVNFSANEHLMLLSRGGIWYEVQL